MKIRNLWDRILVVGCLILLIAGIGYYFLGYESLQEVAYKEQYSGENVNKIITTLEKGRFVEQKFVVHADYIRGVTLCFGMFGNVPDTGSIHVQFLNQDDQVLGEVQQDITTIIDNQNLYIAFPVTISISRGEEYSLRIWEERPDGTTAAALWGVEKQSDCDLYVDGEKTGDGTIFFIPDGTRKGYYTPWYVSVWGILMVVFVGVCLLGKHTETKGKRSALTECVHIFSDYRFLLKQLVGKEFALKYRRSYLGFLWVILNPLMTMIIMSAVFTHLFKSGVENFPVFLIVGQVIFNFFSEATTNCTGTIVGSGQLIKKIYVPKYIFPISKVMFSFVNFVISFIPVAVVLIYFRIPVTRNVLYLPLLLFPLFMFSLGCGLILATMQVFMRDTQYLYSIIVMLLNYLTPVFYSTASLPQNMQNVMAFNPLYHFITIGRKILMYGQAPMVQEIGICYLFAIFFLVIGLKYFYKKQDRFILYI